MRILMSFVGKRDPWAPDNTEGAIVTLSKCLKPDIIVLFPTARGFGGNNEEETESGAELVRECLREEMGMEGEAFRFFPISIRDPRDYGSILQFLRWTIPRVLNTMETNDPRELCINLSSGTPQMQSAWLIVGGAGLLPKARFFEVSRPPRPGENVPPEERVSEVNTNFLREDLLIRHFREALEKCLFPIARRCMEELKFITNDITLSVLADNLERLMEAYNEWDMLDYNAALHKVRKVLEVIAGKKGFTSVEGLIRHQEEVLRRLESQNGESITGLIDIYYNGVRSYQRGAYADCLARFYRLYEGTIYLRLRRVGVEPVNIEKSEDKSGLVGELIARGIDIMSLNKAQEILISKDPSAQRSLRNKVEIKLLDGGFRRDTLASLLNSIRGIRNHSLVGHNMRPISANDAWMAVQLGEEVLRSLGGTEAMEGISSYPFTVDKVRLLMEVLMVDDTFSLRTFPV